MEERYDDCEACTTRRRQLQKPVQVVRQVWPPRIKTRQFPSLKHPINCLEWSYIHPERLSWLHFKNLFFPVHASRCISMCSCIWNFQQYFCDTCMSKIILYHIYYVRYITPILPSFLNIGCILNIYLHACIKVCMCVFVTWERHQGEEDNVPPDL